MRKAKAELARRQASAKKGWETRRRTKRAPRAPRARRDALLATCGLDIQASSVSISAGAAGESRPALVDLSAAIRASLGDIVRGDLVAFRAERVKAGDGASARAMTRIIADFDFVSRRVAREARP